MRYKYFEKQEILIVSDITGDISKLSEMYENDGFKRFDLFITNTGYLSTLLAVDFKSRRLKVIHNAVEQTSTFYGSSDKYNLKDVGYMPTPETLYKTVNLMRIWFRR